MRKARVLIIEEDAVLAEDLKEMLLGLGYGVAGPYPRCKEITDILAEEHIDIILLDIEHTGGENATAGILENLQTDVPLIFLTGPSDHHFFEQASIAVSYGYLLKPVSEREMANAIEMELRRSALDKKLKQSQAALRKSEAKYRHLFEKSPLGIFRTTLDGRAVAVNAEMGRMLGYDDYERYLGDFTDLANQVYIDPGRRKEFVSLLKKNGEVNQFESQARKKDGGSVWLSLNARLTETGESQAGAVVIDGFAIDITERKNTDKQILREKLRLKGLVNILQYRAEDIHEFIDNALVEAIRLTESAFGYIALYDEDRGEFIFNSLPGSRSQDNPAEGSPVFCPLDSTGLMAEAASRGRPVVRNDARELHSIVTGFPYGHMPVTRFIAIPIVREGCIAAVIGLANKAADYDEADVTQLSLMMDAVWKSVDKKKAENALLQSETRLRLALEAAQAGTWEWDLMTGKNIWSDELWGLFRLQPNCCIPSHEVWFRVMHPDDRIRVKNILKKAIADKAELNAEWRVNVPYGEQRWVMSRGKPRIDIAGRVTGYIGIVVDITKRKLAEEERENLQVQLIQAQKMEAIGTLAGGIAHDFNNILGAILGYAEMLREECDPESLNAEDLDEIIHAGNRAKELIKQILAFSRRAKTEKIPMQPSVIVKETIKLLRSSLPATIEIEQDIDPDTGVIVADPTQIHQVVMNLCTNAYQAMEEKGGTLSITLGNTFLSQSEVDPRLREGEFVRLSVRDTGPGIPPAIQKRIFDPYFTTKEVGKGTGIGLSVVHGIVKSCDGYILCRSSLGKGTIFDIYLPTIVEEMPATTEAAQPTPVGDEHILFVDDEKILADMARTMLEKLGYRVTVHTDSLEAFNTFVSGPADFDLVITDQTMPGITGMDLAGKLLEIRPDLPIILCTGYSTQVSEIKARRAGVRGFAMKPFAKKTLAGLIRSVLDSGACLPADAKGRQSNHP
jgi:PAS domain S-box-containing protein